MCVPPGGFGKEMSSMDNWLDREVGRGNYAWHGGGASFGRDCVVIYFRSSFAVASFLDAWPQLEIADGVSSVTYTSLSVMLAPGSGEDGIVCNLYNQTRAQDAMRQLFKGRPYHDRAGNLAPGQVYPDQTAPIVRHAGGGDLELAMSRWGMPSPPSVLKTERDPGVTNVRNLHSGHWRRWLGPAHRCLVPLTSFAEPRGKGQGNQWFAAAGGEPMFFAGIETRGWRSVRKIKDGETADDLFAFLTCEPNAEVREVHPKAMPVILTSHADWETWLGAQIEIAARLQRPLTDGSLIFSDCPV